MANSAILGDAPPVRLSSMSASMSAVPVVTNAVESGIMPATSTTVVHEMLR